MRINNDVWRSHSGSPTFEDYTDPLSDLMNGTNEYDPTIEKNEDLADKSIFYGKLKRNIPYDVKKYIMPYGRWVAESHEIVRFAPTNLEIKIENADTYVGFFQQIAGAYAPYSSSLPLNRMAYSCITEKDDNKYISNKVNSNNFYDYNTGGNDALYRNIRFNKGIVFTNTCLLCKLYAVKNPFRYDNEQDGAWYDMDYYYNTDGVANARPYITQLDVVVYRGDKRYRSPVYSIKPILYTTNNLCNARYIVEQCGVSTVNTVSATSTHPNDYTWAFDVQFPSKINFIDYFNQTAPITKYSNIILPSPYGGLQPVNAHTNANHSNNRMLYFDMIEHNQESGVSEYEVTTPINVSSLRFSIGEDFKVHNNDIDRGVKKPSKIVPFAVYAHKDDLTFDRCRGYFASFGMYFTGNETVARTGVLGDECDDDRIMLGIMLSDGTLTGTWKKGRETRNMPQAGWDNPTDPWEHGGLNPDDNDDSDNDDRPNLNVPSISPANGVTTTYLASKNDLVEIKNEIWGNSDENLQSIKKGILLFGDTPIQALISIKFLPCNLYQIATNTKPFQLGRTKFDLDLSLASSSQLRYESNFIEIPKFKKFYQYEPYSKAELYIPYCGTTQINISEISGHIVNSTIVIDLYTGNVLGTLNIDQTPIVYMSGNCASDVPLESNISTQEGAKLISSTANFTSGVVNTVSTFNLKSISTSPTAIQPNSGSMLSAVKSDYRYGQEASSRIAGAVGNLMDIINRDIVYTKAGALSGNNAMFQPQDMYIRITRPKERPHASYGHTAGYQCYETTELGVTGKSKGFTVCANVDIECNGTLEEKNMLKELLETGVYL